MQILHFDWLRYLGTIQQLDYELEISMRWYWVDEAEGRINYRLIEIESE